ncbi:AMP-binding protein [Paenibacillus sp. SAF-068]|uniref:AMP-binding protein n=1 Tax=Paenibacillus sp. SAF-068 TaxID=3436864 RepID=UPI003F7EA18F
MELNMAQFWIRFDAQCSRQTEEVALASNMEKITYAQLKQQMKKICVLLHQNGCRPGKRIAIDDVGILSKASAFLAIMRFGCTYVHMDDRLSIAQKRNLLRNLDADYFITSEQMVSEADSVYIHPFEETSGSSEQDCEVDEEWTNEFSIVYCSGLHDGMEQVLQSSTMLMNWLQFNKEILKVPFDESLTMIGPSGMELLFPIWLGNVMGGGKATFILKDDGYFNLEAEIGKVKDSALALPIEMLGDWSSFSDVETAFPDSLKTVITMGEHLFDSDPFKTRLLKEEIKWYNYFGYPRIHLVSSITGTRETEYHHIGRAVMNTKTYVLNQTLKPVPVGMIGRLYVSGMGTGKSVNGNGDERTTVSPFEEGEVLHPTAYQAKWNEEGTLTLYNNLNRIVLIDGIEINLDELGNLLMLHPSVLDCWVDIRGGTASNLYILGYVSLSTHSNSFEDLHSYMSVFLPRHMQLSYIQLSRIPRDGEGKIAAQLIRANHFLSSLELKKMENSLKSKYKLDEILIYSSEEFSEVDYIKFEA